MDFYHENKSKKEHWESGQAILHRQQQETKKEPGQQNYELKNSYGTLHYLKKDKKNRQEKEGFSLEAFESPGTPVHTEKEKHIDRKTMKKNSRTHEKNLFTSEIPLHNQALFYEMSNNKKSDDFLKCMKALVHRQGHQTLRDAFGFLEQEPERLELEEMKKQQQRVTPEAKDRHELTMEEFSSINKRIDNLGSRLHKKEAKEQHLCSELQTMLAQNADGKFSKGKRVSDHLKHAQEEKENQSNTKKKSRSGNGRRNMPTNHTIAQAPPENEPETGIDNDAETTVENMHQSDIHIPGNPV